MTKAGARMRPPGRVARRAPQTSRPVALWVPPGRYLRSGRAGAPCAGGLGGGAGGRRWGSPYWAGGGGLCGPPGCTWPSAPLPAGVCSRLRSSTVSGAAPASAKGNGRGTPGCVGGPNSGHNSRGLREQCCATSLPGMPEPSIAQAREAMSAQLFSSPHHAPRSTS